jgi:hypothetical protein
MTKLTKLQNGYSVDLSTARIEKKPHFSSDYLERYGKADEIMVMMFADAVEPSGRRWPCLINVFTGAPSSEKKIIARLNSDLRKLKSQ